MHRCSGDVQKSAMRISGIKDLEKYITWLFKMTFNADSSSYFSSNKGEAQAIPVFDLSSIERYHKTDFNHRFITHW